MTGSRPPAHLRRDGDPLEIRPVRPGEYQRAGQVVLDAYTALPGNHMSGGYAAELADVGRRAGEAVVLVAVSGGDLAGCVTFVPDHSSAWAEMVRPGESAIRMLAVDPRFQGRGTGRLLVERCIELARRREAEAVFLHSTPWMEAAHRLYGRLGFVRVPGRDWLPVPDVPLLAFRLDLTGPAS